MVLTPLLSPEISKAIYAQVNATVEFVIDFRSYYSTLETAEEKTEALKKWVPLCESVGVEVSLLTKNL